MKKLRAIGLVGLLFGAPLSQAAIIDFVQLTEGTNQLGESAWDTLTVDTGEFVVDITATKNGQDAYAYLDWNHAGLGVCGNVSSTGAYPNSGRNRCNPGSDDNVTTAEVLTFMFDTDVVINRLWLNNTHDPDRNILAPEDYVRINGVAEDGPGNGYAPSTSYSGYNSSVSNFLSSFTVAANTAFTVGFGNQQFYVSGMDVTAVPEPGTLGLLAMGLVGLGIARRRKV